MVTPASQWERLQDSYWFPSEEDVNTDADISRMTEDFFGNEVPFLPARKDTVVVDSQSSDGL